jgi:hypothetical protein
VDVSARRELKHPVSLAVIFFPSLFEQINELLVPWLCWVFCIIVKSIQQLYWVMSHVVTCIWSCLILWIMHLFAFEAVWCYELYVKLPLKLFDAMNYTLNCLWSCLMLWIIR